jgi:putative ABC transport system permease protein
VQQLESILQDLRYAIRSLRHTPGVTLTVIVTLILGIGANTILFSIVYGVLFRPLPYPDPDKLVWIGESGNSKRAGYELVLTSDISDWRAQSHSLTGIAALDLGPETLTFSGESQQIWTVGASDSLDRILGVPLAIGRGFLREELTLGGPKAVLLSDNLFRKCFGADSAIIGKSIVLSGQLYRVAGVLPAGFLLPLSASASENPADVDAILSAPIDPAQPRASGALARLKPGVTFSAVRAELTTILEASKKGRPSSASSGQSDRELRFVPLHERIVGKSRLMLMALWGAVTFVLLVACVNVTNLLLAKSAARTRETAIRVALGARRTRLVRQFLVESLVLAVTGGFAGLLVASVGLRFVVQGGPVVIPRLRDATLGWNALLFTAAVSVVTGILFGIVPALRS